MNNMAFSNGRLKPTVQLWDYELGKKFVFDFQSSMVDVNINELHTEMSSFKLYRLFRGVSQAL